MVRGSVSSQHRESGNELISTYVKLQFINNQTQKKNTLIDQRKWAVFYSDYIINMITLQRSVILALGSTIY